MTEKQPIQPSAACHCEPRNLHVTAVMKGSTSAGEIHYAGGFPELDPADLLHFQDHLTLFRADIVCGNMGGVCLCCSWTCRPVGTLFILLAALPVMVHSSQSPAAPVGKMYSRGNHWAVGHLMGKKSIETRPELREANIVGVYLSPSEAARVTELHRNQRFKHLMEALMQPKNQKAVISPRVDRMLRLHSSCREADREKHFREMSNLLVLALELRDNDST